MKKLIPILALLFGFMYSTASAQCDTIAATCAKRNLDPSFISDGQQYRALLVNSDETAEFHTTFYGGTIYRLAACSGMTDGNLVFSIYDSQRNLIFTNTNYQNAPYWDFQVKSTIDCIITAQLNPTTNSGSGCAVILIGFKQQ
ncbi:MAG TPA: hypothetical protein VK806_13565 [Bacteroidia bacterium]|jgi:hypothetical protein|nr:hypothetical protein [Bacteroidia bacterium]